MLRIYPNLDKEYIDRIKFNCALEGNVSEIKDYFAKSGFKKSLNDNRIFLFKNYSCNKIKHLLILSVVYNPKNDSKAMLFIELMSNAELDEKNIKQISDKQFLLFFNWFNKNTGIIKEKVSFQANCQLPVGKTYNFPAPIESDPKLDMFLSGVKFGFNKKLQIEEIIIEKVDHPRPIHFYVKTLPLFNFEIENCDNTFFKGPTDFLKNMTKSFCRKRG